MSERAKWASPEKEKKWAESWTRERREWIESCESSELNYESSVKRHFNHYNHHQMNFLYLALNKQPSFIKIPTNWGLKPGFLHTHIYIGI